MNYLTEEEIILVNRRVLTRMNQSFQGVQYPEGLSIVCEQPKLKVFGHELYPTIWLKAAFIIQKITKKHIFVNGNKRTAYLSGLLFLYKNGYKLALPVEISGALMLRITIAEDSEDEMINLAEFIEKNAERR
ncbi:type II toxin-antitoxin system death-on-curing family toxin [Ligilactobacillus saerimneri]|uniref:type II toxin-antitoxin system death-on-curing family toxin n=1 Tax=Ligilactobacillus saerimneri TaxID=228229 RepID=UPI0022A70D33|nr:type II toxin-antitoxin system death-on-curing family toxin [Ligilactobacillus saerimneri]MCZ0890984.1 type II toxin-antitoxin system death-on-curing family toxin [Ligilactobacillus saerimneri]